uniref:DUF1036 domain-containing protein n=1 Tax=Winogradskyella sp. TaxID=1883156 RepID=UPI0025E87711
GEYKDYEKEGIWYVYLKKEEKKYKVFYDNGEMMVSKSEEINSINDSIEDQYYKLIFKNNCRKPIQIAISALNLDGEWETEGFYNFQPYEELFLANTENRTFYFFAESFDNELTWEGEKYLTIQGERYKFLKRTISEDEGYGNFLTTLTCED